MITFTVQAVNLPPGTAWWTATWYDPPDQWNSGWRKPGESASFEGVPESGWFYARAYDAEFNVLADQDPWGSFTLTSGAYRVDFATRKLVGAPVEKPPEERPPKEKAAIGQWVLPAVLGGIFVGIGGLAWLGRQSG